MADEERAGPGFLLNKKIAIILALIIVVVIISAVYVLYFLQPQPVIPDGGGPAPGVNETDGPEGYEENLTVEMIEEIVNNDSVSLSKIIRNKNVYIAACFSVESSNATICDTLGDDKRGDCKKLVETHTEYVNVINGECDKIRDENSVVQGGKIDTCEKIIAGSCEGLTGSYQISCQSILNKNVQTCLTDPTRNRDDCELDILLYHAMKNNDASECDGISHFNRRLFCKGVLTSCDSVLGTIAKDWTYFSVSRELNKPELCGSISHDEIKNACTNTAMNYTEAVNTI